MLFSTTASLCPVCLQVLDAVYELDGLGKVWLNKACPEHGRFRVLTWDGEPELSIWRRPKIPSHPEQPSTHIVKGCPYDCGLCPEHAQQTCTGQLEITDKCDLHCPVCYARAGENENSDPDPDTLDRMLTSLQQTAGACNIQFSGGEPTMREDLPDLIHLARSKGFPFIQLNSNGLRLANQTDYARRLAAAGLDSVYLQFDGPDDESFLALRGRPLLTEKLAAVRNCAAAGLGVVLVATLVEGVNTDKLGDLLCLALSLGSNVRGLHLQPASSFGRFPWDMQNPERLTLPKIMRLLSEQATDISRTDFHPPGCEHSMCSFSAVYLRDEDGLRLLPSGSGCCAPPKPAAEGARSAKKFVAKHWKNETVQPPSNLTDDFDRFLAEFGVSKRFTISAMAFQDAMNLDLERVRGCCIHVVSKDGRLIPFCLYNLTALDGRSLYRP